MGLFSGDLSSSVVVLYQQERFRKAISENRQLASEYNRRQSYHMKTKANLMNVLDKKLKLESSLRDHKQVKGFIPG